MIFIEFVTDENREGQLSEWIEQAIWKGAISESFKVVLNI